MAELSLQQIYNNVMAGTEVIVDVVDVKDYDNLRTALARKFRTSKQTIEKCGFTWRYADSYISSKLDKDELRAIFLLADIKQRKTRSVVLKDADL